MATSNAAKSRFFLIANLCLLSAFISLQSCKKHDAAKSAFYYWKSNFSLNTQQIQLLNETAANTLYLRFFDISWNDNTHKAFPNAPIHFAQPINHLTVTPVIFIGNKTFEAIQKDAIDSLAINCNRLIDHIAQNAGINYETVQFDCDWTLSTRDKYFTFLNAFKKISKRQLEATIRLHQIKYKEQTGVPPVNRGVLMFYNMGKLNSNPQQANSIYNAADAEKYIAYIPNYPLLLDVALPLFSWSIHIREGRIIQLYNNPDKNQFENQLNFEKTGNAYRAKKSFFMNGVYIKENDIFKLEQTDTEQLKKAAKQLSDHLPPQKNRTIIYYELGNLNLSEFKAETLHEVSADL